MSYQAKINKYHIKICLKFFINTCHFHWFIHMSCPMLSLHWLLSYVMSCLVFIGLFIHVMSCIVFICFTSLTIVMWILAVKQNFHWYHMLSLHKFLFKFSMDYDDCQMSCQILHSVSLAFYNIMSGLSYYMSSQPLFSLDYKYMPCLASL